MGNAASGSYAAITEVPAVRFLREHIIDELMLSYYQVSVLETYPQIIGFDTDVFDYFRTQYVISL
jgi:hypothetical protein